jgi:hypothetical protein
MHARDGNIDDPRTGDSGGELHFGDLVATTGRWTYDAGHKGWNEFHPVKTIQRIDQSRYHAANFDDLRNRWCTLLAVLAPYVRAGDPKPDLTPAQRSDLGQSAPAGESMDRASRT